MEAEVNVNKRNNFNRVRRSSLAVAMPGCLVDSLRTKAVSLQRVTYLLVDDADHMFEIGFEPRVRSIASNIRPDLTFSATMKKKIELLCWDILTDPICIVVGSNEKWSREMEVPPESSRHLGVITSGVRWQTAKKLPTIHAIKDTS